MTADDVFKLGMQLIIIFFINSSYDYYKNSETSKNCLSQFPKAQCEILKCFVLSDQQSKT